MTILSTLMSSSPGLEMIFLRYVRATLLVAALALVACSEQESDLNSAHSESAGPNAWLIELQERPEYQQACEETPGCLEARQPVSGPLESVWRVQVIRDGSGSISIGRVDTVQVPEDKGVPPGRATGDYLLVGVDGSDSPVDGQLIQFPRTFRIEYQDRAIRPREIDLKEQRVDTIGYIRAKSSIRTLQIQDQAGNSVAIAPAPVLKLSNMIQQPGIFEFVATAHAQSQLSGLPPYCSHIWILQGEADREYAGTLAFNEYAATLEVPKPYQLAAVQAALNRMTPLLCGAVGRIAFAHVEPMENLAVGAVLQAGEGEMVMINSSSYPESELENQSDPQQQRNAEWRRLMLQTTVLHESGHSVEALLNATGADPGLYGGDWQVPARSVALAALESTRLHKGFGEEWRRVHNSFVALDYARAHSISGMLVALPDDQVVSGGFMTSYGSNIWWDDISEFISEIYMGPVIRTEGFNSLDLACKAMQAWNQPNVPSNLSSVYTKTLFLRDLELVKAPDVQACLGGSLGLQNMSEGFHFWVNGQHRRSFTQNLKAGIHTESIARNRVFVLEGEGEAGFGGSMYPAKLTLRLDLRGLGDDLEEVSWPRGVYELGLMGDNNVQLVLEGAKAGNFDAMDGFVLVAEASKNQMSGSIVLQRAMRLQAPLPVPQVYDPPLVIRFMKKKST